MISMIIMLIVFLSFASIISYSVMTMNQNLIATGSIETTNNELRNIKQVLISEAKPILSSVDYALPYGTDDSVNDRHTLPSHLNLPLKNQKGYFYQYCPYGLVDGTSKTKNITQNDGSTYSVATTEINSVDYVTHSENAHSLSGAPEVLAFILSTQSDEELNCQDVLYSSNENTFYSNNAKVVAITKSEVEQYNRLNNLSGVTDTLILTTSNFDNIFSMIENDVSNKSYEIVLERDLSLSGNYNFLRAPNKKSTIFFDLGSYELSGNLTFNMSNIDLNIKGSANDINGNVYFPQIKLTDSNAYFESSNIGGITLNNSKITIDNAFLENIGVQSNFSFFNSEINIRNNSIINYGSINSRNAALELKNSTLTIEKNSTLTINKANGTLDSLIKLENSEFDIYGSLLENNTKSTRSSKNVILIDHRSSLYLNGGVINVKGNLSSNGEAILLKGKLSTSGESSSIRATNSNNLDNLILVKGGELLLENVSIGQNSGVLNVTIKEDDSTNNLRGIAKIIGNANIYRGTNGCFEGEIFKKSYTIDNSYKNEDSGSDSEDNNLSNYICN